MKTPNDPTTIASARETLAGVDEPTTTSQNLAAWILAKDYERLAAERDELRAACESTLARIEQLQQQWGKEGFTERTADMLRAALSKGDTP